ncbi:MAG: DUF4956 domain-containing protein [Acetatifactor sp.]|nr:DUF4956 domain-containing protein [Acetatifactor sp.]
MSVKDIIKSSFLQSYQSTAMTVKMMLLYLLAAALIGIFIYGMYRLMTKNTFYSKTFNLSLMLLCVITAAIIITIQSSIVVSLGMVGALSIVRFRTAVKDPLDLVFLFWAISAGIITGARMVGLAIVLSAVVAVLLFLFRYMPDERKSVLLVVKASDTELSSIIQQMVEKYVKRYSIKSKLLSKEELNIVFELRLKSCEDLMQELNRLEGISSVSLIAHRGEE